ncbi:glutamate--cysteine ligase catalytic subunit-like isoform X1 [Homarus americanus]|uniref:glutamate--cysteine ligase catalytic subunit-like isoform X1 n=1 Tax=Homarus americanus TaxID=6706 RepID=UPI001C4574B4|nr:glutamate--cysteine ligase catalytic subunit-like isoform X1 [Homarus americanus]
MGLLSEGTPLSWPQTKQYSDHVREHGIKQFINQYHQLKGRQGDCLKWGDEIEYMIIKLDHKNRKARLSLRGSELLEVLREAEETNPKEVRSLWRPEYAEYMVEGTPGQPYGSLVQHFNIVEHNMSFRRSEVQSLLLPDEVVLSLTNFPRLGCPDFTYPPSRPDPNSGASRSLFFPEEAITQSHPRFKTLTRNIRERRGEKVAINVPIYVDLKTPRPFVEDLSQYGDDGSSAAAAKEDQVYMDAMGFGMGCSCLQMTFQACNVNEARVLYDHLTPLCPVMLALTAASPIYRGYLTDVDCRWNVIAASVDCRTREERGLEPLRNNRLVIPKSRYDSVDCYLSECGARYNDIPLVYDKDIQQKLVGSKVDEYMAQHISHLFIRDSISLFSERIHQDDAREMDHFENIQSTNWQTMRFKLPPVNSNIGWRVEFRPCEVQLTDFENAAFGVFIVLLTRALLTFKLNMLIPISKVDENMANCQKRNAVLEQKLWFRQEIFSRDCDKGDDACQMTVSEIINGKGEEFVGLIPLVRQYLGALDMDADTACTIGQYLNFISARAAGTAKTTAAWMRNFVTSHPEYKQDSVVSDGIAYDLIIASSEITQGKQECKELLGGTPKTKTSEDIPKAMKKIIQMTCMAPRNAE